MDIYLSKFKLNPKEKWAQIYAKVLLTALIKRFPSAPEATGAPAGGGGRYMLGSATDLYVCGLFVHPFYRGNLLKSVSNSFFLQRYKFNIQFPQFTYKYKL
jgi:hypothetical protein